MQQSESHYIHKWILVRCLRPVKIMEYVTLFPGPQMETALRGKYLA